MSNTSLGVIVFHPPVVINMVIAFDCLDDRLFLFRVARRKSDQSEIRNPKSAIKSPALDCIRAGFAGTDAQGFLYGDYENLAVSDFAGIG